MPFQHPAMVEKLLPKTVDEYFLEQVGNQKGLPSISYEVEDYTHGLDMLRHRKQIACLDSMLNKEREAHAAKQVEFRKRWLAASAQMRTTDEIIVTLDEPYQQAIEDRNRKLKIISVEEEAGVRKKVEVRGLQKQALVLRTVRDELVERVKKFKPVEDYLERVKDCSQGEFRTVHELMDRFNLLKDKRDDLIGRELAGKEMVERGEAALARIVTVKENEYVLLNNYIFELTEDLENLERKEGALVEELASIKTSAASRATKLSDIRIATYNLYRDSCKMMERTPNIPPIDTERQLQYIQGSIVEMNRLRRQARYILKHVIQNERESQVIDRRPTHKRLRDRELRISKAAESRNMALLFGIKDTSGSTASSATVDHLLREHGKAKTAFGQHGASGFGLKLPGISGSKNRVHVMTEAEKWTKSLIKSHPMGSEDRPKFETITGFRAKLEAKRQKLAGGAPAVHNMFTDPNFGHHGHILQKGHQPRPSSKGMTIGRRSKAAAMMMRVKTNF